MDVKVSPTTSPLLGTEQYAVQRHPSVHQVIVTYRTLTIDIAHTKHEKVKKARDPAADIRQIDVHKLKAEEVYARYRSHPTLGLETPALERQRKTGQLNRLSPPKSNFAFQMFGYVFGGFNSLMWFAMILSFITYQPLGPQIFNLGVAVLLLLVIAISALFYGTVDFNASQAMRAIKQMVAETAWVIRDGVKSEISALDLQVGDVVHFSLGQRIPADTYLTHVSPDFKLDRSLLTGESDPTAGSIVMTDENPLETKNLALSSTFVVQGTGEGIVFAIGDDTVIGRIFTLSTRAKDSKTILQKELTRFTIIISSAAITSFSASLLVWGLYTKIYFPGFADLKTAIINSIGCLTALVPQGLPVCVALALTIVARRMAERKVLVKNLSIIETVGAMSVLCSDKTGTLTEGKMSVENIGFADKDFKDATELAESPTGQHALRICYFCNDAAFVDSGNGEQKISGNSTDVAVYKFAIAPLNTGVMDQTYTREFAIPFNSKIKYMLVILKGPNGFELQVKGAPDILSKFCDKMLLSNGESKPLEMMYINERQDKWSGEGQRVIMTCVKALNIQKIPEGNSEVMEAFIQKELSGLTVVSLIGIRDPPRKDVPDAVSVMRRAGIRIFMVTGDFRLTAESIARHIGILTAVRAHCLETLREQKSLYLSAALLPIHDMKPVDEVPYNGLVLDGKDVLLLEKPDWDVIFSYYPEVVFARTTPEQKMVIVQEAKKRGDNVVGVTGDGVNDAPALKVSDVGIAMGAGSDVAKEAASVILLNNDFSSIPIAIENGRLVFENLRKVVLYVIPAGSYCEMMAVFSNVFLGMQIPLTSYLQVFFCIFHDVIMSISLMYESAESDLMLQKPRNVRTTRLVDWKFFVQIYLFIGPMIWLSAFGMFFLYWRNFSMGFFDFMLVFDMWVEGYKGHSLQYLNDNLAVSQTIFYVTMVIMQIGNILAVRNRRQSIFESNPFYGPRKNLVLVGSISISLITAILNVYISTSPSSGNIFYLGIPPAMYWLIPFPLAIGLLMVDETRKLIVRRYPKSLVAKAAW